MIVAKSIDRNRVLICCLINWLLIAPPSLTLPPPEDIPEEILRTEIILEGR